MYKRQFLTRSIIVIGGFAAIHHVGGGGGGAVAMHLQKETVHGLQLVILLLAVIVALFTLLDRGLLRHSISFRSCTLDHRRFETSASIGFLSGAHCICCG